LNDLVDAPLNGPAANTLAAATARLRDELTEHLTAEDRDILPVIEQFVTIRDLDKADGRIKRTAPLHALLFLVAWLNSIAEPHERRAVPLRFLLPPAQRRYQRHTHTALTDGERRETAATADIDYTGFLLAHKCMRLEYGELAETARHPRGAGHTGLIEKQIAATLSVLHHHHSAKTVGCGRRCGSGRRLERRGPHRQRGDQHRDRPPGKRHDLEGHAVSGAGRPRRLLEHVRPARLGTAAPHLGHRYEWRTGVGSARTDHLPGLERHRRGPGAVLEHVTSQAPRRTSPER
jgi:hypothetical protein